MIKQFRVQNYKCLRDVTLDLTPIHVLIGPNDSGKTSILEAIAALCRSVDHKLREAFTGWRSGSDLVWHGDAELLVSLVATLAAEDGDLVYERACKFGPVFPQVATHSERIMSGSQIVDLRKKWGSVNRAASRDTGSEHESERKLAQTVLDSLMGVHLYRWNPSFLALPVAPYAARRLRMEPSGFGLAMCLDDILGYDRDRFIRLEDHFKRLFPDVESVKLIAQGSAFRGAVDTALGKAEGKGLHLQLSTCGGLVSASQVSDGMLLVLAYLTVLYLPEPPRVLLIEEPENGVHPKRLQDVLKILRELVEEQEHTQVILTTHSPYVVDLFKPEEVTLCRKESDGSISVHRLSKSKKVREQLDVFTLGEIWTAEGDEALARPDVSDEEAGQ